MMNLDLASIKRKNEKVGFLSELDRPWWDAGIASLKALVCTIHDDTRLVGLVVQVSAFAEEGDTIYRGG